MKRIGFWGGAWAGSVCAGLLVVGLFAVAPAHAGDADWCAGYYAAGCDRNCCVSWPYEYTHAAPRNLCIADCKARAAAGAVASAASSAATRVYDTAASTAATVSNAVSGAATTVKNTVSQATSAAHTAASQAYGTVATYAASAASAVSGAASSAVSTLCKTERGKTFCDFVSNVKGCLDALSRSSNRVELAKSIRASISPFTTVSQSLLSRYWDDQPKLRLDLKACWDAVATVGRGVADAVCQASTNTKAACAVIADAAGCLASLGTAAKNAPAQVRAALDKLQPYSAGSAVMTAGVVGQVAKSLSGLQAAAKTCLDYAKKAALTAVDAVCKGNEFCAALQKELARDGITSRNWQKNPASVALAFLRAYFPRGKTRELKGSIGLYGGEDVAGEAQSSMKASMKRLEDGQGNARDTYEVSLELAKSAMVGLGLTAKELGKGARGFVGIGGGGARATALRLDLANGRDYKLLAILGVATALDQGIRKFFSFPGGSWLVDGLEAAHRYLLAAVGLDKPLLAAYGLISSSGCRLCLQAKAVLGAALKQRVAELGFELGGELCGDITYSRDGGGTVTLSLDGQVGGKATIALTDSSRRLGAMKAAQASGLDKLVKDLAGSVSGGRKLIELLMKNDPTNFLATLNEYLSPQGSAQVVNRLAFSGVPFPEGGFECPSLLSAPLALGKVAKQVTDSALKKAPSISTTVRVRLSVGAGSVSGYELQIDATGLRMPLLTVAPILGLFPSLLPDTTFTVTVRSVSGRSREPDVGVGPGGVKGSVSSESTQVIFSKDYSTAILRATAPAPSTPTSSKSPSSTKKGTASSR